MLQGDIWLADLEEPRGSGPAYARPVIVVQSDRLNRSRLSTVVVVPLTSNLKWAAVNGNVTLAPRGRLTKPSVANVSQVSAYDRSVLRRQLGRVSANELDEIMRGIDFVLSRH
jgi:mRNA interferase MazF